MGSFTSSTPGSRHRLAIGGAWFFAVASLFPLLWLASGMEGPDSGTSHVFRTTVDGHLYTVPGLAYSGVAGWLLLWAEIAALIAANVLTLLPHQNLRRGGLFFLTWWNVYWMLGVFRLSLADPGFFTMQTVFLAGLCACTIYRQCVQWSAHKGGTGSIKPFASTTLSDERRLVDEAIEEETEGGPSVPLYGGLKTDVSPLTAILLRKRDVSESPSLLEVTPTTTNASPVSEGGHGAPVFTIDRLKNAAGKAIDRVKHLNDGDALKLRRAGRAIKHGTARGLDAIAKAASKGAQKLGTKNEKTA